MRLHVSHSPHESSFQAFAIRCLREEPREREFADSRRSGKKQGMRHAFASKGAAQCGHNPFVTKKFRKGHCQTRSRPVSRGLTADKISLEISSGMRIAPRVASKH